MNECAWNICGIILTEEDGNTRRKNCPTANLSTKNPTFIGLVMNPGFCGDRLANKGQSHGTACMELLIIFIGPCRKKAKEIKSR
jgi:hypothetical protein